MKAARQCPFKDLEPVRFMGRTDARRKFCLSRHCVHYRMHNADEIRDFSPSILEFPIS